MFQIGENQYIKSRTKQYAETEVKNKYVNMEQPMKLDFFTLFGKQL